MAPHRQRPLKLFDDSIFFTKILRGILNPTVAQIFARHPVYDNIFCRLSPASFARMSRVCRDVREATKDFATRAYNIDRRLRRYFSDPLAFRVLMSHTGLLISGSFALQFFDRSFYPGSDLDLYVWTDESVLEVGRWLAMEGYIYKPSPDQRTTVEAQVSYVKTLKWEDECDGYDGGLAIHALFSFERQVQDASGKEEVRKIQVIVPSCLHNSPLQTILKFHSTCVMNVITYDTAYSLYPYATFELRDSLVLKEDLEERTRRALRKYADRGFRLVYPEPMEDEDEDEEDEDSVEDEDEDEEVAVASDPEYLPGFFVERHRQINDKRSWRIPLNVDAIPKSLSLERGKGEKKHKGIPVRWRIETSDGTYNVSAYGGPSII